MTLDEDDVKICSAIGAREMTIPEIMNCCGFSEAKVKMRLESMVRGYAVVKFRDWKAKNWPNQKYKLNPQTIKLLVESGDIDLSVKKVTSYPATNFMKLLEKA